MALVVDGDDVGAPIVSSVGSAVVVPQQSLTQSGTLDVDLKTVAMTGTVTLNGGPLPTGLSPDDVLTLGGVGWDLERGGNYAMTVFAGTSTVVVTADDVGSPIVSSVGSCVIPGR